MGNGLLSLEACSSWYSIYHVEESAKDSWPEVVESEEILMGLVDAESLSMDKATRRLDTPMCRMQAVHLIRGLERSDH
jgi:hypothetical protein